MTPLAQLIQEAMDAQRLTRADVVRRGVPWATLTNLLQKEDWAMPPRPATLAKIHDALGVPLGRVERAADESVRRAYERQDLPHGAPTSALVSQPGDSVLSAIEHDPLLLPEAKEHLQRQYLLLKRLSPDPETTAIRRSVTEELAEEAGVRPIAPRTSPDCRR